MYASNFKAQQDHWQNRMGKADEAVGVLSPDGMREVAHGAEELQPNLYPVTQACEI